MAGLSKLAKLKSARSHDEARAYICCVCGKKVNYKTGGVQFVNQRLSNLVCQFVHDSFSAEQLSPNGYVWNMQINPVFL